jgi:hypothetical protein
MQQSHGLVACGKQLRDHSSRDVTGRTRNEYTHNARTIPRSYTGPPALARTMAMTRWQVLQAHPHSALTSESIRCHAMRVCQSTSAPERAHQNIGLDRP